MMTPLLNVTPALFMQTALCLLILIASIGVVQCMLRFSGKPYSPAWIAMLHGLLAGAAHWLGRGRPQRNRQIAVRCISRPGQVDQRRCPQARSGRTRLTLAACIPGGGPVCLQHENRRRFGP